MSASDQPTEEELRAAYEAEIKKIRVEQILLEQVVSLVNLGHAAHRAGARAPRTSAIWPRSGWRSRRSARCCR